MKKCVRGYSSICTLLTPSHVSLYTPALTVSNDLRTTPYSIPAVKPFNQRGVVAWEREVRLVVAKATRLPALVHVVRIFIAEFLLGRLRYVLRVRVQLAIERTKAWDVIVFAGRRRRRRRRWLPLAQFAGFLASLLLLIPVTNALLLFALFVSVGYHIPYANCSAALRV